MSERQSSGLSPEDQQVLREQVAKAYREAPLTMEQCFLLLQGFHQPFWETWLVYLRSLFDQVEGQIWLGRTSWDRVNFLRGQRDVLERIRRAPEDIAKVIEEKQKAEEQRREEAGEDDDEKLQSIPNG